MPVLEWTSDFNIGIHEIDLQHRSLVSIANQLYDAIETGRPGHTVEWILEELLVYTKMHFQTEEQYMRRYEHDRASQHAKEHAELLKAMRRFKRKFKEGAEGVDEEVLDFLSGWLGNHLTGSDRALGEAYQARVEARR